mmetsp:Transcript_93007/g.259116  ORF Transcript_93007/g.259116 Transcript_93007/m.259116 type:complete len:211 (+) Transcript_93007:276-908(+)
MMPEHRKEKAMHHPSLSQKGRPATPYPKPRTSWRSRGSCLPWNEHRWEACSQMGGGRWPSVFPSWKTPSTPMDLQSPPAQGRPALSSSQRCSTPSMPSGTRAPRPRARAPPARAPTAARRREASCSSPPRRPRTPSSPAPTTSPPTTSRWTGRARTSCHPSEGRRRSPGGPPCVLVPGSPLGAAVTWGTAWPTWCTSTWCMPAPELLRCP